MSSVLPALLLLWAVTAVHEAGHALAVRLKGGNVQGIEIGRGPSVRGVLPGGTRLAVGLFPIGGRLVYRGVRPGTGHAVVALAGPAANLLIALLMLGSATQVGIWLWLVPGSVVELLLEGRAFGLLQGMRIIGQELASGTPAGIMAALGALSAVWAALNLLPIPGIGSDGWAIVRSVAAAIRGERGSSSSNADPIADSAGGSAGGSPPGAPPAPDVASDRTERGEVS